MKIIIKGELTDYNTYGNLQRSHWSKGAKVKKNMTEYVKYSVMKYPKIKVPGDFTFTWFVKNKRKDPDNICSARKFILDGLVQAGKLQNDGWNQIIGFTDIFFVDKDNPRVEIDVFSVKE